MQRTMPDIIRTVRDDNRPNAATKRTVLMLLRPEWFEAQLLSEIDKAERKAAIDGIPALFRLNGTSDLNFDYIIKQRPHSLCFMIILSYSLAFQRTH